MLHTTSTSSLAVAPAVEEDTFRGVGKDAANSSNLDETLNSGQ
jgi:hypothetical protein